jgi:hypothetical protein
MITYVGLELGVDTAVLTNSVAPRMHLRQPRAVAALNVAGDLETAEYNLSGDADSPSERPIHSIMNRENEP